VTFNGAVTVEQNSTVRIRDTFVVGGSLTNNGTIELGLANQTTESILQIDEDKTATNGGTGKDRRFERAGGRPSVDTPKKPHQQR
jgi:hypothetical protein